MNLTFKELDPKDYSNNMLRLMTWDKMNFEGLDRDKIYQSVILESWAGDVVTVKTKEYIQIGEAEEMEIIDHNYLLVSNENNHSIELNVISTEHGGGVVLSGIKPKSIQEQFNDFRQKIAGLETEKAQLKDQIDKLTDQIHTGFGGNS